MASFPHMQPKMFKQEVEKTMEELQLAKTKRIL
jgi:hypothetical protein